jgi:hypothetical protein
MCIFDKQTHSVFIEYSKHQRSKFTRIALWKELFVDFDETLKLDDFFVCVGGIENEK